MAKTTLPPPDTSFDTELADLPPDLRWREWMNRIEAVLFASAAPIGRDVLARVVGRDAIIDQLIDDIRHSLLGKPYDVVRTGGGWAFRTRPAYSEAIQASAAAPSPKISLTQTEAMVLVWIAYHQPITRGTLGESLGREVSRDLIGSLRDKDLITAGPRSPTPGAPFTYVTTSTFLDHFGLGSLQDLPPIETLENDGLVDLLAGSAALIPVAGAAIEE